MIKRQSQERKTKKTFHDKWVRNPELVFLETLNQKSEIFKWILGRNGFKNLLEFKKYLKSKKRILDAGCGNGRVTALLRQNSLSESEIVGIDVAPISIAKKNLKKHKLDKKVSLYQADIMKSLKGLGKFDFIYCQEVLHHTSNPKKAFHNLVKVLNLGGEIAIYVYKEKSPAREYIDDYIRERISKLSYKEAIKVCEQITEFGRVLSKKNIKIKIPNIDILDIKSGEYDLQRFIYYFFMKCFWDSRLSFKENTVINFDWYHPQLCSRHTIEEIRNWFKNEKLKIVYEYVDFYGITMRGKRLP